MDGRWNFEDPKKTDVLGKELSDSGTVLQLGHIGLLHAFKCQEYSNVR